MSLLLFDLPTLLMQLGQVSLEVNIVRHVQPLSRPSALPHSSPHAVVRQRR